MIEVGVGSSNYENTLEAAEEAARLAVSSTGMIRTDFALVFATPHHSTQYSRIIEQVKKITGAAHISGCSGIGVLTHREEIEEGPGIAVMAVHSDTLAGYSFLFHDLLDRDLTIGRSIGDFIRTFHKGRDMLCLFPDPYALQASNMIRGIQDECGCSLPILGGCASDDVNRKQPFQFHDKDVASGSIAGIYLTGDFTYAIGIAQACHPVSGPLIVTRAEGKRIYELRNRPALEFMEQLTSGSFSDNPADALEQLMIGLTVDPSSTELESGEYIVRKITSVDPSNGSILTTEDIREGQPMSFVIRDPMRTQNDFEEMLDSLSQSLTVNSPRFGLYVNCAGKGRSLYHTPNVDTQLIRKYFGEMPLIGFSSYGEFAPIHGINCLHSFAGILALVSDPME